MTASVSAHDMREVDRAMLNVIERGEDLRPHPQFVNGANIAAIYHLKSGGQRIRARLALHSAHCLSLTKKDGIALAATADLTRNASLIQDDLQDHDEIRRYVVTLWVAYADAVVICAGDLLLSAADSTIADISCVDKLPRLLKLVHSRAVLAPTLNVVQLLQKNNAMTSHQAWESAKKLGLKHLQVAPRGCADLPLQSGRLLRELANDRMAQLKDKCIQ